MTGILLCRKTQLHDRGLARKLNGKCGILPLDMAGQIR